MRFATPAAGHEKVVSITLPSPQKNRSDVKYLQYVTNRKYRTIESVSDDSGTAVCNHRAVALFGACNTPAKGRGNKFVGNPFPKVVCEGNFFINSLLIP
jgi:hypothetical protein